MERTLLRPDFRRLRLAAGWTIVTAGALHGLARALPLLAGGA